MARILSTKKLTPGQKELLLAARVSFVEYDFIEVRPIEFAMEESLDINNAIFTSQNAVKAVLNKVPPIRRCFCVGDKTEAYLLENEFQVAEKAYTAKKLAEIIINHYPEEPFVFFCGDKRREELPALLSKKGIMLTEIEVYKTAFTPKRITGDFDGALFFSPSAVESFVLQNDFENTVAFCIGKTTEKEAKKYTNNVITANKTTIENVIVQVIKYFRS